VIELVHLAAIVVGLALVVYGASGLLARRAARAALPPSDEPPPTLRSTYAPPGVPNAEADPHVADARSAPCDSGPWRKPGKDAWEFLP
jgi:hypothetical protein